MVVRYFEIIYIWGRKEKKTVSVVSMEKLLKGFQKGNGMVRSVFEDEYNGSSKWVEIWVTNFGIGGSIRPGKKPRQ